MRLSALALALAWAVNGLGADLRYNLILEVGETGQLHGQVTVSGVAQGFWNELAFRLYPAAQGPSCLFVRSAHVGSERTEWFSSDPTTVRVPLELSPGQTYSVTLEFAGQVPPFGAGGYGIFARTPTTLTLAQAYPILAVWDGGWVITPALPWGDAIFAEAADYTAEILAPLGWTVVASGSEKQVEPGRWRVEGQNLRELGLVLVRGYEVEETFQEGVQLRSFFPTSLGYGGRQALEVATQSLAAFDPLGAFPFLEVDLVAVPLAGVAGVEYPGLILAHDLYYDPSRGDSFFFAMVVAHELAHQFWYAEVGSNPWSEPWLDEALTTYTSGLYFAEQGELHLILSYWERSASWGRWANPQAAITSPLSAFPDGRGYGGIVYSSGALWFRKVEARMGSESFFRALRRYREEFRWRIATGKDLLRILSEESVDPLGDLLLELGN